MLITANHRSPLNILVKNEKMNFQERYTLYNRPINSYNVYKQFPGNYENIYRRTRRARNGLDF